MVHVGTSLNHLPVECDGAEAFDGNLHSLFAVHYLQTCAFKHKCTLQEHPSSGRTTFFFLLRIRNKVMVSLYKGNVDNIYTSWSAVVTLTLDSLLNSILVARLTQLITYCQSWNGSMSSKESFVVQ